jgi:hypothetical protein
MSRQVGLALALVFTAFFAALTISVIVRHGIDILEVASLVVLVLLGIGLYGALTRPPEK